MLLTIMKKILFIIMILGLGFSSCQKDDNSKDQKLEETFVLNGKVYNVEEIHAKFALMAGVDRSEFTWVPDSLGFRRVNYSDDDIYKIELYIESLTRELL